MTAASATTKQEQTVDAFLGGLVTLVQPRKGHRAGLDAALLQALVPSDAAGLAVDLGAGVGTVAFSVAARVSTLSVVGVEIDAELVAFGLQALALPQNARFARRVRLVATDVSPPRDLAARLAIGGRTADFVLMNPPFDQEGRGTQSPDARRRDAHVAAAGLLKSWTASALALLAPGGRLAFIHRADALAEVFDVLSDGFGGVRIWPLYPSESAPASRILVSARRGSRGPLSVQHGLILHQAEGKWTPRADAILRGKAELAL